MYEFDLSTWHKSSQYEEVNARKRLLFYRLSFICVLVCLPLTIKHLVVGSYLLALLNTILITLMLVDCFTLHRYGRRYYPFALILISLVFASTVPIYFIGVGAVFWSFPVSMALFFLLRFRDALWSTTLLIGFVSAISLYKFELELAVRIIITLLASGVIGALLSGRIRKAQDDLSRASTTDPLTGAYNRRFLKPALTDALKACNYVSKPSAIALFDLDNFKTINDTFGHDVGDESIIELVRLLEQKTHTQSKVFRLGGDEILLLLKDIQPDHAKQTLETLRLLIAEHEQIPTTSSIGLAFSVQAESAEHWLKLADRALYQAKSAGRNQVKHSHVKHSQVNAEAVI